jgi:hypothetical protein
VLALTTRSSGADPAIHELDFSDKPGRRFSILNRRRRAKTTRSAEPLYHISVQSRCDKEFRELEAYSYLALVLLEYQILMLIKILK